MTARELPRQLFVVAERGEAQLRMRLLPAHEANERPAAVNGQLGIAALELIGPGGLEELAEVFHAFRRLDLAQAPADDDRLARAFAAWRDALARSGITLRLERRALYGAPLPHKNWQADPRGVSLRPWDVELTTLAARLRTIVKLDRIPPDLLDSLRQIVGERGLCAEIVAPEHEPADRGDPAGAVTLLVAREASDLHDARALEAALLAARAVRDVRTATLEMGALLGYPACCVERFTQIAEQNDTTLAWALLPGVFDAPASPLTQWLQPGLALLSHTPCDLHCPASIAVGRRILAAIETTEPGFSARWWSLAARLQIVDRHGTRMALAVDGSLDASATVTAADMLASSSDDPEGERRTRRLIGRIVTADTGGLVVPEDDWYAPYVADHRDSRTPPP